MNGKRNDVHIFSENREQQHHSICLYYDINQTQKQDDDFKKFEHFAFILFLWHFNVMLLLIYAKCIHILNPFGRKKKHTHTKYISL